ncbi:MAG: acetate--CoA ligase family protein [Patescibacteria group bacterium]
MLDKLFSPRSVAVIGASRDKQKLGHQVLANILKYGYRGKVYPVNPAAGKILGLKCYRSALEIKGAVDLAVVAVPAAVVPQVLAECGQKKIPSAIVISAGFKEIGGAGAILEAEIKAIAKQYSINLLGPNCLGIMDVVSRLNASFADGMISPGGAAFFSQSGAVGTAMLDWSKQNNFGFSRFISLGNKADISENEILEFLAEDKNTKVILGYLEGFTDGRKFLAVCQKATALKPVIILKAGRTAAGKRAITSHTGALAGQNEVTAAALKQAGAIQVDSLNELFDYARLFASQPLIRGNRLAIVANAGGPSVMATDAVVESGLQLAKLSDSTLKKLKAGLPATAAIHNPVDLVGDARADRFELGLNAVLSDKAVDAALAILTPQTMTEVTKTAEVIVSLSRKYGKTVATSFIGGAKVEPGIKILTTGGVPNFLYPEAGVRAMGAMAGYQRARKLESQKVRMRVVDLKTWKVVGGLLNGGGEQVGWQTAEEILKIYKIPMVKSAVAADAGVAVKLAGKFKYPVVLKVAAKKLLHKTDAGGVLVGLKTAGEVETGFKKLNKIAKKFGGEVLIQPQILGGREIIMGVRRDPQFGPVVMFGLGGIYTEILKDVVFRVAPLDQAESLKMIQEIKAFKLLSGARGEKGVKLAALADMLCKLSELATDFPQIEEVTLNPVLATTKGCLAVDVRIITNYELRIKVKRQNLKVKEN